MKKKAEGKLWRQHEAFHQSDESAGCTARWRVIKHPSGKLDSVLFRIIAD
jgi:hypothetical protein